MEGNEKTIEVVTLKVSDLNFNFGNPRKIDKKGLKSIGESFDRLGDFGVIVIDENNSVICGNQRVTVLKDKDPNTEVLCKRLIGYTKAEKRAINLKDNRHEGVDDLNLLAPWIADLNITLGIDPEKEKKDQKARDIELLEPKRYEKYNYVLVVCRSELDWNQLALKLGIDKTKELIAQTKTGPKSIKCRAVWYDELPVEFVPKEDLNVQI